MKALSPVLKHIPAGVPSLATVASDFSSSLRSSVPKIFFADGMHTYTNTGEVFRTLIGVIKTENKTDFF